MNPYKDAATHFLLFYYKYLCTNIFFSNFHKFYSLSSLLHSYCCFCKILSFHLFVYLFTFMTCPVCSTKKKTYTNKMFIILCHHHCPIQLYGLVFGRDFLIVTHIRCQLLPLLLLRYTFP